MHTDAQQFPGAPTSGGGAPVMPIVAISLVILGMLFFRILYCQAVEHDRIARMRDAGIVVKTSQEIRSTLDGPIPAGVSALGHEAVQVYEHLRRRAKIGADRDVASLNAINDEILACRDRGAGFTNWLAADGCDSLEHVYKKDYRRDLDRFSDAADEMVAVMHHAQDLSATPAGNAMLSAAYRKQLGAMLQQASAPPDISDSRQEEYVVRQLEYDISEIRGKVAEADAAMPLGATHK